MHIYEKLRKAPFNLDEKGFNWVTSTLEEMTQDEKIGQLFCMIAFDVNEEMLTAFSEKLKVGGIMGRPLPTEDACKVASIVQSKSKIPMLIAANLESGGDGLAREGTNVGPNMQVAATGEVDMAAKQGSICAIEGTAVGGNWAFAPVIDIDYNFRNPITATRTYGSDPQFVKECGVAFTKAAQEKGMAVSIKHFPGDGVDERDQHLVTSINDLSCSEWDLTFGEAYKASIEAGALTVMAGHIMLPEYSRNFVPDIKDEEIMPATLAPELLNGLLREKLGFNGMIVSDATTMVGVSVAMPRPQLVPHCIAAGCDMFLFTKNFEEDYGFMKKGVIDGVITEERLNEAVARILAVKAALKLHEKKENGTLVPTIKEAKEKIGTKENKAIELECSDKAVTLVKDLEGILPLDKSKYKKILLHPIEPVGPSLMSMIQGGQEDFTGEVKQAFEKEGFEVDIFKVNPGLEGLMSSYFDVVGKYDLLVYASNLSTKSNQTTVRIEWQQPFGANCPSYIHSIPTIFISFANPYHLLDVPRVRTFINAYKYKPANLKAVIDKLMGRSEFKGKSPVDAFVGRWDTKL
jgi:beta-N-acetylhexosaminidase